MSEFEANDNARHAKPDLGQLVPTDKSFTHSWEPCTSTPRNHNDGILTEALA